MKILTKEFCKHERLLSLCDNVKVLQEAQVKDDKFFDELYNKSYNSFLKRESGDFDYDLINQTIIKSSFDNRLNEVIELIKFLPQEIINKIADPRVFALGYVSQEVKDELLKYKDTQRKTHLQIIERVKITNKINARNLPKIDIFEYDEILLKSLSKSKNDYTLSFDGQRVKLYSAEIIEKDFKHVHTVNLNIPHSGYCVTVYCELYFDNGLYELHLLLDNRDLHDTENLCYLTISCKNIKVI